MSDHSHHDVKKDMVKYLMVFAALLVGTILTVWASYIHFGSAKANIVVALVIATIKASLVAGFFMHLFSEKWTIHRFLILTAVFALGLFLLTALAFNDHTHLIKL
jgi:cytochrome c oxidase subunit 4